MYAFEKYGSPMDPRQSILKRRVYWSMEDLERHVIKYSTELEGGPIGVFKFEGHLPRLSEVELVFRALNVFSREANQNRDNSLRLIRLLEHDWFMEVCAAAGAAGGVAKVIDLILELYDRRTGYDRREREMQSSEQGEDELLSSRCLMDDDTESAGRVISVRLDYMEVYTPPLQVFRIDPRDLYQ